jgi:GT2 family glycosyltransferase
VVAVVALSPVVSAVVVTYRRADLLEPCLASLQRSLADLGEAGELIVIDTGAQEAAATLLKARFPDATLIRCENIGLAGAASVALERSRGEWIALLNDDVTVAPLALSELLEAGRSGHKVGSVAAQMRFHDRPETINSAGIEVDQLGEAWDRLLEAPVEASETGPTPVFGACGGAALYRRAMLEEIGGFDSSFFAYLEDVDVAWRAAMRGWSCVYAPAAVVYHHFSASFGHRSELKYFLSGRNRIRLLAKNADRALLLRRGAAMIVYDLAYITFVAVRDRTLAPARGRFRGLAEWRRYRRAGRAGRSAVALAAPVGLRGALRRRRAYSGRLT